MLIQGNTVPDICVANLANVAAMLGYDQADWRCHFGIDERKAFNRFRRRFGLSTGRRADCVRKPRTEALVGCYRYCGITG